MLRDRRFRIDRVVLAALLLGSLGCASTAEREEEAERRVQRANSHFNIAVDHQQNGRIELALRELLNAQRIDPQNPKVLHGLGITYLMKGKEAEAEKYMKQALEIRLLKKSVTGNGDDLE